MFELQGADNATLDHLNITGAATGVWASTAANSDGITLRSSNVFGNTGNGVYIDGSNEGFTLQGGTVHNNGNSGIYLRGDGARVQNAEVYGNTSWGVDAYSGNAANPILIENNKIHDNGSGGVTASNQVKITGNEVYGHGGGNRYGISLYSGALAQQNFVYKNDIGILVYYGAIAVGNEVYANKSVGISLYSATASGNRVYSNPTGIAETGYSQIENNVVYANTNVGISIGGYHNGQMVRDNTLYLPVGDAVLVGANAQDVKLYNNIVWVNAGYAFNVGAGQVRFVGDYNLVNTPGAGAKVGLWSGTQQTTLADWRAASTQDAHSKAGDPLFLDIDGADNVLGEQGVVTGNGFDDNFGLRANSPAIDAANMYVATSTDIQGLPRRDDPSTANTGDGLPLYVATPQASGFNASGGTPLNNRNYDYATQYTLPFAFTFYGQSYTTVYINTNGFLQFGSSTNAYNGNNANTLDGLIHNVRIAPLWDDLSTYSPSDATRDLYVDSAVAGQVTIRWAAVFETNTAKPANFSVTLFNDGRFRFDYGPTATGLTPTVGVSAGNGQTYVLASYDGQSDLSSVQSLLWNATPGLTYYDIGAYEFLGDSNDHTPPHVTAISQLPANGGTTAAAFSSLQIDFSETLDGISARSPANYDLLYAGADGLFGTPDDSHIALKPGYSFPETNLTLQLVNGVLADGNYRLRLSGTLGIFDTAGNLLDGNNDGTGGDDYVRNFTIDRTHNQPPTATDAVTSTPEDQTVTITLKGTDPEGDVLTYSIVGQPRHGLLANFNAAAHTVDYTPDANFNGTDSFKFHVDDGNLGGDDGTLIVNVLPVNDRPVAPGTSAATDEDTPVVILLPASDIETAQQQLAFSLATAPQHGTLTQGPNGLWTYTPNANFNGSDSFTYTATDRGDPDGSLVNAATSLPGTVTITIRPVDDAPVIQPIGTLTINEGSTLSYAVPASDVDNASLHYSLVNNTVVGAAIDANTGLFTWKPADGPLTQAFTVRVGDGTLNTDATFNVAVANVAPTISLVGVSTIDANVLYTLAFSATDPGTDTISSWLVNWGDGATSALAAAATGATHSYGFGGQYGITVKATDEDGSTTSAPLSLKVIAPNRAPIVPQNQTGSTPEDQPVVLTLAYSDPDSDPLTFNVVTGPAHGTLGTLDPVTHKISFTPSANYNGADSFVFSVTDTQGASASTTLGLTVTPVNDAPVAQAQTVSVKGGTTLHGQVTGADLETPANALTFQLGTTSQHGNIVLAADGGFTYTPTAGYVGTDSFSFTTRDAGDPSGSGTGPGAPITSPAAVVSIDVSAPAALQVTGFTPTASGFTVRFNQGIDLAQLNLYSGEPTNLGAADVVLKGPGNTVVTGSLIVDADRQGFTFLRTGGVLPAGNYSVTLAARADGIKTLSGTLLDGNLDGTGGDNYVAQFSVAASTSAVLGVGEIARGPGQTLATAASGFVFPITLNNAAGATRISFTLNYDPALLAVTGLSGGNLPAGSTVTVDTSSAGQAKVSIVAGAPLAAGRIVLGNLAASVPVNATYGAKDLLHFSEVQLDQGAKAVRTDDGLHVVAFLGDVTADGSYTTLDTTRLRRLLLRQDNGLGAWPLVDPLILGNISGNGVFTSVDVLKLTLQVAGTPQKDFQAIPTNLPPLVFAGADPALTLGSVQAQPGSQVVVPVNIDTAAGLQSVQITVRYDSTALTLVDVQKTPLTQGFTNIVVHNNPGELVIDATSVTPLAAGTGELFGLNFAVASSASGSLAIDMASARLNDTWLTLNPQPQPGADTTDGMITVLAPPVAADAQAHKKAAAPLLMLDKKSSKGFSLGSKENSSWLSPWVAQQGKASRVNHWSVSPKPSTIHRTL